ncbi:MAG: type IV secretion protein IcmB [Pseudomonadota bacterium]
MGILEKLFKPMVMAMRQPVESFIRLETADDSKTLVSEDGSLISYLKIDGSRQIIGEEEYRQIINQSVIKIGSRFDRPGQAMQVYFTRNPDRIEEELRSMIRPAQLSAKNIGLEIDDIFEERARHLTNYLSWEEIYVVLWTRPSVLSKTELKREAEVSRKKKWVVASNAQNPLAAFEALRNRHDSFTSGINSAFLELGIQSKVMEAHDALFAVRTNLLQTGVNSRWRACLPGDPLPPRAPESSTDMSDILWPPLRQQISTTSARVINDRIVEFGQYIWSGMDMVLAPMEPAPFPKLLSRLAESKVPFRISFLIEGGGVQGAMTRSFVASLLAVTNTENHQIKDALESLEVLSRSEPVVKLRISFTTWAPKGETKLLEERTAALMQSAESWGYCQVSQLSGDPLDCVMSSAMGIACASTAPSAIAPLHEVLKLLPWQRASSPFESGSILLRTPDGRVWPYQTGTNLTTTWFDLVFAQPGGGKSVLMNTLNLGTCLTAGVPRLPYIAVIDIGPSSAGLISLIKDALPPSRQHEAVAYRLQMTQQYAINPFDTKLGLRRPLADERSYLIELLTLLCTPPGKSEPYDGIAQLAGMVIDEIFRWRDDNTANAEPRKYLKRIDPEVDAALEECGIQADENTYWWDVVDLLFDKGRTYEATLAQRNAVPTLGDSIAAARRPQIRNLLEETQIGGSSEGVIHAFERMITSAVREFPILSSVTKFSLAENRITALDLADVCPQGDDTADRQTSIMYMLARHALITKWWLNEEALAMMPEKYRPYHEDVLRDIAETPKRLCFDEFHRTSGSKAVRSQLIRDVREGRKRGIQIVLASQLLDDFDDDMVDLATGVWILGAAVSDRSVDNARERFGLSDTARWIMRNRLTGPRSSGGPCMLILGTTDGRYEQHLINTLGPIELWAFSTSSEDVAIRSRLYARLGASQARRLLAANFPGGSARSEIRRRVQELAEANKTEEASVGVVIEKIVSEMIESTQVKLDDL